MTTIRIRTREARSLYAFALVTIAVGEFCIRTNLIIVNDAVETARNMIRGLFWILR